MPSSPGPIVVFDLDDTLYLERDYVRSGFRAVADEIGKTLPSMAERSFEILWQDFERGERTNAFDRLLAAAPDVAAHLSVDQLIGIYRTHAPRIEPMCGTERVLQLLRSNRSRCGLITDGRLRQQRTKLTALRLGRFFDSIIINDARDRFKPDVGCFQQMEHNLEATGSRCWYVADNPAKDFIGPNRLGWRSIRLRVAGQLWEHVESTDPEPDFTVDNLYAVIEAVENN
jgi:putative hydrolase of the HAD superfamily